MQRASKPAGVEARVGDRVERLRGLFDEHRLDGILIQKPENRLYLTGFSGSAGIALVTPAEAILVVDFRYVEQAGSEAPDFAVVRGERQLFETMGRLVTERPIRRLGFESDAVSFKQYQELGKVMSSVELVPIDTVDRLRWVKDADELARITKAVELADAAFAHVLPQLRPGAVERDIAVEMEFFMRRAGADREAFESIVASGPRSSLPHGRAADRVLAHGDFVTLDFGATYRHYISDCTRTVVLGDPDDRQREVYQTVLAAQRAALDGIRPGMSGKEADALARDVIASAGYADAFGHSLGHGVGLAVHEGPTLSPREEARLAPGMVVTVEPGIYLAQWGGVRIEDLVLITDAGCTPLTHAPKELLVL